MEQRLTANEMFTHLSRDGAHHVLRSKFALKETKQRNHFTGDTSHFEVLYCGAVLHCLMQCCFVLMLCLLLLCCSVVLRFQAVL